MILKIIALIVIVCYIILVYHIIKNGIQTDTEQLETEPEEVFMENDFVKAENKFTEADEHSPSQLDIDKLLKLLEVRKQIDEDKNN